MTELAVKLPEEFILVKRNIENMAVGDSGWTKYYAMQLDKEGGCWLSTYHELSDEDNGDTTLIRIDRRADGYHVLAQSHLRWKVLNASQALYETWGYFPVMSFSSF